MSGIPNDDLKKMKDADIEGTDISQLKDIEDVKIDPNLPKEERMRSFVEQIGNPYLFRCNGHIVRVKFDDTDRMLEDCLQDYFNSIS